MDDEKTFFLVQHVERWKMRSWERNKSDYGIIQYIQIATGKCVCSQVTVKQSLKTQLDLIGKFKWIGKMTYNVVK